MVKPVNTPAEVFKDVYTEVVNNDTYRLRQLDFQPDVILDIGANIGTFSWFCSQLFPKAKIIAVEPNTDNFNNLKNNVPESVTCIQAALGYGSMYFRPGSE